MHTLLFSKAGLKNDTKKNIRAFSGVPGGKENKDWGKKITYISRMYMPLLKEICLIFGLERSGSKEVVTERILDFIVKPEDKGLPVPQPKGKKRSRSKTPSKKKGKT